MITVVLNLLLPLHFNSQNRVIDSLKTILKTAKQDTNRVKALTELCGNLASNNPDTAIVLANQALILSQKLNWKIGEARAEFRTGAANYFKQDIKSSMKNYNNALAFCKSMLSSSNPVEIRQATELMGRCYNGMATLYWSQANFLKAEEYYLKGLKNFEEAGEKQQIGWTLGNLANVNAGQGNYPKALEFFHKALIIAEEVGDKQSVAALRINIANVYCYQAKYPEAFDYFFAGLKMAEEMGNKRLIGTTLVNIASVYANQPDYAKAVEYYLKGLKISEEVGDRPTVGRAIICLANVFKSQANHARALEYYLKGLKISEEIGNKQVVGATLGNIANVYRDQADYANAAEYYLRGIKTAEEIGDKALLGLTLGNSGIMYLTLGKYQQSENDLKKSLLIAKEIGAENNEMTQHLSLTSLYEKTNRPALALEHYKKFIALRDTIFSQENSKKLMRSEMDHEYEKKKAVADAEHKIQFENQKLIAAEKSKKQNIVIVSVIAGLILVIFFAGYVFKSLRVTRKQKLLIEIKNKETEHQKKEIEEKQREILDSIHYAKRIQMAQIPSQKRVATILKRLMKL